MPAGAPPLPGEKSSEQDAPRASTAAIFDPSRTSPDACFLHDIPIIPTAQAGENFPIRLRPTRIKRRVRARPSPGVAVDLRRDRFETAETRGPAIPAHTVQPAEERERPRRRATEARERFEPVYQRFTLHAFASDKVISPTGLIEEWQVGSLATQLWGSNFKFSSSLPCTTQDLAGSPLSLARGGNKRLSGSLLYRVARMQTGTRINCRVLILAIRNGKQSPRKRRVLGDCALDISERASAALHISIAADCRWESALAAECPWVLPIHCTGGKIAHRGPSLADSRGNNKANTLIVLARTWKGCRARDGIFLPTSLIEGFGRPRCFDRSAGERSLRDGPLRLEPGLGARQTPDPCGVFVYFPRTAGLIPRPRPAGEHDGWLVGTQAERVKSALVLSNTSKIDERRSGEIPQA
ncbi:unnamed protein product [Diplocarpon coronariae]